jgi:hypothetical protein
VHAQPLAQQAGRAQRLPVADLGDVVEDLAEGGDGHPDRDRTTRHPGAVSGVQRANGAVTVTGSQISREVSTPRATRVAARAATSPPAAPAEISRPMALGASRTWWTRNSSCTVPAAGRGSPARMASRHPADARKLTASPATAAGAPASCTSQPPSPGPVSWGGRPGRLQVGVALDQPLPLDQGGQVAGIGNVEQHPRHPDGQRHHGQLGQSQAVQGGGAAGRPTPRRAGRARRTRWCRPRSGSRPGTARPAGRARRPAATRSRRPGSRAR